QLGRFLQKVIRKVCLASAAHRPTKLPSPFGSGYASLVLGHWSFGRTIWLRLPRAGQSVVFCFDSSDSPELLLKITIERDPAVVLVLIGDRFGIKPIDNRILDRIGEEMIPGRAVMADEIALHVLVEGDAEVLEIFDMHQVHIEGAELVFAQKIDDRL